LKTTTLVITLMFLTSCATSNFDKRKQMEEAITDNLVKEDRMVGAELPAWVDSEGMDGGFIYAVGEAEYSASKSHIMVKQAAAHAGKMKIAQRLPAEYKYIVQRSLSNASDGEFNQVEIAKGDLYGLRDVKTSRRFTACRKIVRYTEFATKVNRVCYVQASVPIKSLNEAVERTIRIKYGEETGNKFRKILEKQVEQELMGGNHGRGRERSTASRQGSNERGVQDAHNTNATSGSQGGRTNAKTDVHPSLQRGHFTQN